LFEPLDQLSVDLQLSIVETGLKKSKVGQELSLVFRRGHREVLSVAHADCGVVPVVFDLMSSRDLMAEMDLTSWSTAASSGDNR
jgi:hypothetical protein